MGWISAGEEQTMSISPDTKMYGAHDALICIADGAYVDQQESRQRLTPQHYSKTQAEMVTLFADCRRAIEILSRSRGAVRFSLPP
jgi:DNA polymerase III alpha subunit